MSNDAITALLAAAGRVGVSPHMHVALAAAAEELEVTVAALKKDGASPEELQAYIREWQSRSNERLAIS